MEYLPSEPASTSFTMEYLVLAGFIVVALLTIGIIFAKLYVRAPKDVAFVRTGLGGQRVIKDGGALKLPVLHDITWVNMRTLRLEVQRRHESAMITFDRMRVDIGVEFYVRVKPDGGVVLRPYGPTDGNTTIQVWAETDVNTSGEAIVRVGHATADPALMHQLAAVMAAYGVPTVEPLPGAVAVVDGVAVSGWRRVAAVSDPVDWAAVGR